MCKLINLTGSYKRKQKGMFFSEHSVDAAYCYRLSIAWFVGRSVTQVSAAKTTEPIEMPFVLMTRVGPGEPCIRWDPDHPMGRGNFERKGRRAVEYRESMRSSVQKNG